ncbi:MAG: metallopeptidase family protein [Candidatus Kaiserbacteria bacterium]|nr:MAG: metallopeptidase family protein [Candidatus Kaiserbacteria bacterium]
MHKHEFEKKVAEGFERLPEWIRKKINNVALLIEDDPSDELCEREGLSQDETLLGYYHGIPLSARGDQYGVGPTMPDTITLFQNPIETAAEEDGMDVRDVIADTIWHEYAHHFGMNEAEVRAWEEKRNGKK